MRRLFHTLTTVLLATALCAPGVLTLPVLQAATMRVTTPRLTLTMVERGWGELREGRWPVLVQGPVELEAAGHLARAVVSAEDGRFFVHNGFDWDGICAAWKANQGGGRLRGGSTISQQSARNLFLFQQRSWVRKGLEVVYTIALEAIVPKRRILELYLSVAESGTMQFGFEAASQAAFGKPLEALTATQAAQLVYLLPNPRERSARSVQARKKAAWIHRNLAPLPGDRGHERLQERWNARPSWPLCP